MINSIKQFFAWLIYERRKDYKEDHLGSFANEALIVLWILGLLFMGATKCMNTALHRDTPPKIEQAVPAGSSEQTAPLPKSP